MDWKVLQASEWFDIACADIRSAKRPIIAGAFTYNGPTIHSALITRLRQPGFGMQILVDQATYDSGKLSDMKQKLLSLKKEGAEIYLCSGARRSVEFGPTARGHGPFHSKLIVVDRRVAYHRGLCAENKCGKMYSTYPT